MVTVEFRNNLVDGAWIPREDNQAFAVFGGPHSDVLQKILDLDPDWSGFVGTSRIRRLAKHVAVTGRDGTTRSRLPKGRYVVCWIRPFPYENVLEMCDTFDLLADTRITVGWVRLGGYPVLYAH